MCAKAWCGDPREAAAAAVRRPDQDQAGNRGRRHRQAVVNEQLGALFEENPAAARKIINKAIDAAGLARLPARLAT